MGRNSRTKKKTQVIFDESERSKYLLGFRKRKEERRKKAKEEIEKQIKLQKKHEKEMRLQAIAEEREKAGLPSLDEIVNKNTQKIELTNHTIMISDIDNLAKPAPSFDEDEEEREREINAENGDEEQGKEIKKPQSKRKIQETLGKLEKRKRLLEQHTQSKKKAKASKKINNSNCNKSSKKFHIKEHKIKNKLNRKKKKKS